jgi:Leucine-rich repeat (LRR) protein
MCGVLQAIDNNILTTLPDSIGDLLGLKMLILRGNQLTRIPNTLANLHALTMLNLSSNNLTEVPEQLGALSSLTVLQLNSNHLSTLPSSLTGLVNLKKVNLSNNSITELPLALIACWRRSLPECVIETVRDELDINVDQGANDATDRSTVLPVPIHTFDLLLDCNPLVAERGVNAPA